MNEIAVHWPTCAGGGQGRPVTGFEIARNMPPAYRRVNRISAVVCGVTAGKAS